MFAGNRMSDKSGSTRNLRHLINREIPGLSRITDDVELGFDWARGENLLIETIDFAENNPQLLLEPMPEDERPWCTPRSLHQADDTSGGSSMSSFETDKHPHRSVDHRGRSRAVMVALRSDGADDETTDWATSLHRTEEL